MVEMQLKLLVCIIYAELFKPIHFEYLKSEYIQNGCLYEKVGAKSTQGQSLQYLMKTEFHIKNDKKLYVALQTLTCIVVPPPLFLTRKALLTHFTTLSKSRE